MLQLNKLLYDHGILYYENLFSKQLLQRHSTARQYTNVGFGKQNATMYPRLQQKTVWCWFIGCWIRRPWTTHISGTLILLFTCTETKDKIFIVRKYNQFNRNVTEELEILQVCPSANFYDCKAMSIGARSQSARTYLEKKLDDFGDCELEPLVAHGLRALRDTLPKEVDLTNKVRVLIMFEILN